MLNYIKKNLLELSVYLLAILRLAVDAWLPLLDKTEARYAEIARIMYETDNWVTPQIDYDVPFWAKPPMSTWISAISFNIFGVNEFAARFPSFFIHILLIIFIVKAFNLKRKQGFWLAFIMLTIPEYYIHSGVVSTDSSLLVGVTFIMVGFWKSINTDNNTKWKLLTWFGVAIGMLAKGPITLVLTVPPLFIWSCLYKGKLLEFFKKSLWIPGLVLAFTISGVWYYLAEIRTPGFIDYFFVGEHYKRFVESGWKGDKYGFAKQQPMGMIWLFLLLFSMPWIQYVIVKIVKNKNEIIKNKWISFLLLWMLWTPFFFTVSKSLIHTYTLPCTIPLGLLVLNYFKSFKNSKSWVIASSVVPILLFFGFIIVNTVYTETNWQNTDKHLVKDYNNTNEDVYAWRFKSYSSQFYTSGKITLLKNNKELDSVINLNRDFVLLSKNSLYKSIDNSTKVLLKELKSNRKSKLYSFMK